MPTYPETPATIVRDPIKKNELQQIGRLVRAFAEVEDCLAFLLTSLCKISPHDAGILLGQITPIRRLIDINLSLAKSKQDGDDLKNLEEILGVDFDAALGIRNGVAHGAYLGRDRKTGGLAFRSSRQVKAPMKEGDQEWVHFGSLIVIHPYAQIRAAADFAEKTVVELMGHSEVKRLREEDLKESPQPHPKAPTRRRKSR